MSKGQKAYFIICSVVVGITAAIHLTAFVIFLSAHFGAGSQLGKVLSLALLGVIWFVGGGVSTFVSLVMSIILIKVSKKWALTFIIAVILLAVATFACWYLAVQTSQPEPETSVFICRRLVSVVLPIFG